MSQYCSYADQSAGGCPYDGFPILDSDALVSDLYGDSDRWHCKDIDNNVNPDIGGIGVSKIQSSSLLRDIGIDLHPLETQKGTWSTSVVDVLKVL